VLVEVGRVALVGQIGEERPDLRRRQHALVHDGARRQRGEVDREAVLGPLAQAEGHPVEGQAGLACLPRHENLGQVRQRLAGARAAGGLVDRHVAPAEDGQPLVPRQLGDPGAGVRPLGRVGRQEDEAAGVAAGLGEAEPDDFAEERVRQLGQDAGAVAGVRVRSRRSPVLKIAQDAQRARYDVMAASGGEIGDETHTAGVMFETAVV